VCVCTGERKLKPLKPYRGNIDITTGKLIFSMHDVNIKLYIGNLP